MHPAAARGLLVSGTLAILAVTAAARPAPMQSAAAPQAEHWFKGNTHTHTVNSDGDSTPDEVVRWYREHGYNFLVLTDHNYLTSVDGLNAVHGAAGQFLVIPGEEVTMSVQERPVHVNGLGLDRLVVPPSSSTVGEALRDAVRGVRDANGVPHVNHPNFRWALTPEDLRQVERTNILEIFNGHPQVNNLGGGGVPGLEEVWDRILSSGRLMYGIAVDDAHHFKRPGDPSASGPGRGWVYVRAPQLEGQAIVEALDRGDFYASTGVELAGYSADRNGLALKVRPTAWSKYRVQFIGRGGRLLSEIPDANATYAFKGDEGYVRAKVLESNGLVAWTQPVAVGADGPKITR